MKRLVGLARAIWASVAFRLTLNYSVLALLTSLVSLAFVYHQTVRILESQFSRQVETTAQRMNAHFNQGGLPKLQQEITLELADNVNTDTEMFLLLDPQGTSLVGNIELDLPDLAPTDRLAITQSVTLRGRLVHGYLVARKLADGSVLIIGYDLRDLREITGLIKRVSLVATGVIALLVLLGAYVFRRTLQQRVKIIRDTAAQVSAGKLTRRVPMHSHPDEFAMLTRDINHMLDRIESLMKGVRNVSDAAAHHLRTPLMRMLSRLRATQQRGCTRQALEDCMDYLTTEIEDLANVSEKLLQIAEFEAGTRRKKFETVRLDIIARDVVDLYEVLAEEQGIALRTVSHGPVRLHGDPDLLAGAIANLVDNALKYAGKQAHIRVEAAETTSETLLAVVDDGPGMTPERVARLGERFYRANSEVPGYGLGLATVIAIARLHGAHVKLADAQPGLRVSLHFPADGPQRTTTDMSKT